MLREKLLEAYHPSYDIEQLRMHGAYWPSNDEVLNVFDAARQRAVYQKLANEEQWHLVTISSILDKIKQGTILEFHTEKELMNRYHFGGFYSSICLLIKAGMFKHVDQFKFFLSKDTIYLLENLSSDELKQAVLEDCALHATDLEMEVLRRVRSFNLEENMFRAGLKGQLHAA